MKSLTIQAKRDLIRILKDLKLLLQFQFNYYLIEFPMKLEKTAYSQFQRDIVLLCYLIMPDLDLSLNILDL